MKEWKAAAEVKDKESQEQFDDFGPKKRASISEILSKNTGQEND